MENIDSEDIMDLHRRMERYIRRSGTAPTRVGRESLGDPRLVFDMRRGRELRAPTAARLAAWLDGAEQALGGRPWKG
jgi:hypothetical protein